jgi:hypothetical protein
MIYRLLARFIVAVHAAYVAFVVLGSLLVLRWPRLLFVHLAAVVWGFATLAFDLGCPLTPWEKSAWRKGGVEPYPEGFLQHHVLRNLIRDRHSRMSHALLGAFALLLNVVIYAVIFSRR